MLYCYHKMDFHVKLIDFPSSFRGFAVHISFMGILKIFSCGRGERGTYNIL